MGNKKTPSGKPRAGEQTNQANDLMGVVTFTGSVVVNLRSFLSVQKKGGKIADLKKFYITDLTFNDAGGAATVTRLAGVDNGDGTFTINASKDTAAAGVLATATNACTVTWCISIAS